MFITNNPEADTQDPKSYNFETSPYATVKVFYDLCLNKVCIYTTIFADTEKTVVAHEERVELSRAAFRAIQESLRYNGLV